MSHKNKCAIDMRSAFRGMLVERTERNRQALVGRSGSGWIKPTMEGWIELPKYRDSRQHTLCQWSMEVLSEMGLKSWASVLRFIAIERKQMYDIDGYFDKNERLRIA